MISFDLQLMVKYLIGEKVAGENKAGLGLCPTNVGLLFAGASGVVCGLLLEF